ncbi:hypothetical protein AMS68_004769 [Peltaster fructicola]|uniref:Oxidoreductase AflY n=1 Tax=Peltaster fructicola TaxID=286661 RepID=A0A6H0XWV1_9PEZI|nr:hypothetical protein AMS68_004769 [Peltaster fructicola]
MSTTTTVTSPASAKVELDSKHLGFARIFENPAGSVEAAQRMLQKNHDEFHIFWRDVGGHNHMAHAVLSVLALGGTPEELQRAYDDGVAVQRSMPPLDEKVVQSLHDAEVFRSKIGSIPDYINFLYFFEQEIDKKGWQTVCNEYLFTKTPIANTLLARMYEGAYHPIIHLGLGIEFQQPSIIAEGLAQAATHDSAGIEGFFLNSEALALESNAPSKSLIELFHEVRDTEKIRTAARVQDGPVRVREGVIGRAGAEITALASQYKVKPDELERAVAEMISCNAFISGAAQRARKVHKIDFFHMHNVTSSIFLSVLTQQPWIKLDDKVRLIEWKSRLDLVWYAASAAAKLDAAWITDYVPTFSAGMDWISLYKATNKAHDDGHVAKFIRAIKNGFDVAKPFESSQDAALLPVHGDMWFKVAQLAYDTTLNVPVDDKWVWGTGFDPMWMKVPAA